MKNQPIMQMTVMLDILTCKVYMYIMFVCVLFFLFISLVNS